MINLFKSWRFIMFKDGEIIKIKDNVFMNQESGKEINISKLKAKVVWANPTFSKIRFLNRKIYSRDEEGNIRRDLWFSNQMIEKNV